MSGSSRPIKSSPFSLSSLIASASFLIFSFSPISKFSNKLLDLDSYIQGYIGSPEKFKQDYDSLLDFSKDLNEELHSKKVKESQRSLLISGILIALENETLTRAHLSLMDNAHLHSINDKKIGEA